MSKLLFAKIAIIFALMLALLVPIGMISGLVSERQAQREGVLQEIAQSASGTQQVMGPVLVLPYRVTSVVQEEVLIHQNGQANTVTRNKTVYADKVLTVLPEALKLDGKVATKTLYRGLYQALTYSSDMALSGHFVVDAVSLARDPSVTLGQAYLAVGISDVRGIRNAPRVVWQGQPLAFEPGIALQGLGSGIHAPLKNFGFHELARIDFSMQLELLGTQALSFVPVGRATQVSLTADWPHPSFFGRSLPADRAVRESGFDAKWQSSWFNNDLNQVIAKLASGEDRGADTHAFGVRFIQPVDEYQETNRALKYAILFVVLTFTGFFLFEILKSLPIHPMQYALVGAALAMFYLLLVALSEHIAFAWAYLAAGGGCVALISFYLAHVLRRWQRGAGFGALLALLYATLYGLLLSEDNALLLGALLLFGVLAAVMVLTRKLDWYQLRTAPAA